MKDQNERSDVKEKETRGKSSRKPNRKERRDRSKSGDKFYKATKGSNDLSWHTPDAELLHRTAMLPWSYQTGEVIRTNKSLCGLDEDTVATTYASQAGFMVIRDHMSVGGFGSRADNNQASYTAANSLLTTMRSRTRVRNTYDAPDVMMLMLAMGNIYGTVAWYKRLAATVRMFAFQNHYMPRDLIRAQGVDPVWFEKNQYTFVTQLNVIISEINKIYIPARMHLFELYNQRFSNYYTEGTDIKDQIYFFTPAFISEIDYNATEDYQSMIKPIGCFPGTMTTTDGVITACAYNASGLVDGDMLLLALRQMVRRVIEHDSTADITGDMENAFGTSERFILSGCDPDAVAAPIFDEEILETIHNTAVLYGPRAIYQSYNSATATLPYFCTVQDVTTNHIGTWDQFYVQKNDSVKNLIQSESSFNIIDVHKDPTPEKTFAILRTRNVVSWRTEYPDNYVETIEFAADLICNIESYYYIIDGDGNKVLNKVGMDTLLWLSANNRFVLSVLPAFHYRPMQMLVDGNYQIYTNTWYLGETDIYSFIPDLETVRNMNRLSLLTLLGAYNNL